jgi:peptide/nickel transport system permease protein
MLTGHPKQLWQQSNPMVRIAALALLCLYASVAFAGFLAPTGPQTSNRHLALLPPTAIYNRLAKSVSPQQVWVWPYVLGYEKQFQAETLSYQFLPQPEKRYPLQFFFKGEPYKLFGLIPCNRHLLGVQGADVFHPFGTDSNGRDLLSRLLYGGQLSLTIGFLALLVSLPIGLVYGGFSGFIGGWVDVLLMRLAELVMSVPSLFLLLALAALLPASLSSSERFILVTLLLALLGWAGLARVIRGMVLALRQQEYVEAAQVLGASPWRVLTKHLLPQTASFAIVAITLGVPGYILAESGLSFLGLGIQQPDASWGNLLKEAQELVNLLERPWMLTPGLLIILAVWAFNVLGDWLRDELDPKSA